MTDKHGVPAGAAQQTSAAPRAAAGLVAEPSDAERSRTLVAGAAFGALATMSIECPGFPFGSLAGYAVDDSGRAILCLSALAEHSRNMAADPKTSLMVTQETGGADASADPLALARVTLVGEMATLAGADRDEALERYRVAHPGAFYVAFHDFSVYRLAISAVRYVGGFARMSWVGAEAYGAAEPDPLRGDAARILEHMNADHADALIAYSRVFGGLDDVRSATMVGVDRYGMDITARAGADDADVRVAFPSPAATATDVRAATVALLREAQERLTPHPDAGGASAAGASGPALAPHRRVDPVQ